jgi:Domain of unknown function (DUF4342)
MGEGSHRTWVEEIDIAGRDLVERMQHLLREGNVRRVILRDPNDNVLIEVPLPVGVAVGGVVVLAAPVLAALGAIAALVTNFRLQVVRADEPPPEETSGDPKAEQPHDL